MVRNCPITEGYLVLRAILDSNRYPGEGKLAPTWDGPFPILKSTPSSAYWLTCPNGTQLPHGTRYT